MRDNFEASLAEVLKVEGGYVHNPDDPGGATNHGITQRVYSAWLKLESRPDQHVFAISLPDVTAIYRAQYAAAIHFDELPRGLDYALFDAAVNSGPVRAISWLQAVLGETVDGHFGLATFAAIHAHDVGSMIETLCQQRLRFMQKLRIFKVFGRGWVNRIHHVVLAAEAMAAGTHSASPLILPPFDHKLEKDPVMSDLASSAANTIVTPVLPSKPWYASQTIWGGVATIAASTGGAYAAFRAGDMNAAGTCLMAAMGGIMAIVGRFKATSTIGAKH